MKTRWEKGRGKRREFVTKKYTWHTFFSIQYRKLKNRKYIFVYCRTIKNEWLEKKLLEKENQEKPDEWFEGEIKHAWFLDFLNLTLRTFTLDLSPSNTKLWKPFIGNRRQH